jgi:O-acetylhomoserine/O-acetylserine sulfhydrylase-like pyridoxal-dependent enzyme
MLAVNHPNVVLAKAETKFLAPVVVGETVGLEATDDIIADLDQAIDEAT